MTARPPRGDALRDRPGPKRPEPTPHLLAARVAIVRTRAPTSTADLALALASLGVHAALLIVLLAPALLRGPGAPPDPPMVELVIGNNAQVNGKSPPAPQPAPATAPQTAPTPPPPPAQAAAPPSQPQATPAPPLAPRSAPPPAVAGDVAAASPAAVPMPPEPQPATRAPPSPAIQPSPPMPRMPPQQATAQAATPQPPPAPTANVNLGEGIAAPAAEIADAGLVHPAEADTGNIPPEYPLEAKRRHEQGTVVIGMRIGADGSVLEAWVVRSSGSRSIDAAARDRLATWHFHPATQNNAAVPDVEAITIHFAGQ